MLEIAELAAEFRSDPNVPYRVLVGFEYEVFLFDQASMMPLGYGGERGLGAILAATARWTKGKLGEGEQPNKVDLPWGGLISLEPGGQFEFSSAPVGTFGECLEELGFFLRLIDALCQEFGLHPFYGGVTPVHTPEQIGLELQSDRYRIMNDYFPTAGQLGRRMMRQTTSVQVTFDYRNEQLGIELLRASLFLAPLACAIFANSPFVDGAKSGYRSYRARIWQDTDPARCGAPPGFGRADYCFADYLRYVMAAPMFFVRSGERLVPAGGITFAEFNRSGFGGREATLDDFLLHNSTIFTDARLKRTVEVRSVDGQDPAMMPAVLAFLSGLLLCKTVRPRTLKRLSQLEVDDFDALSLTLAREGLSATVGGVGMQQLALELLDSAAEGLATCYPDGKLAWPYLEPLRELVLAGKTPADCVLERFDSAQAWLAAGKCFDGGLALPTSDKFALDPKTA